jgi:hypothetical protein
MSPELEGYPISTLFLHAFLGRKISTIHGHHKKNYEIPLKNWQKRKISGFCIVLGLRGTGVPPFFLRLLSPVLL